MFLHRGKILLTVQTLARCLNKQEVFLAFCINSQTKEADKLRYFISLHIQSEFPYSTVLPYYFWGSLIQPEYQGKKVPFRRHWGTW